MFKTVSHIQNSFEHIEEQGMSLFYSGKMIIHKTIVWVES